MENQNFDSDLILSNLKKEWRIHLIEIRDSLDPIRSEKGSLLAHRNIKEWVRSASLILSFASFRNEINLWPLNEQLASENRLVLPRLEGNKLCLYQVFQLNQLKLNRYGLLEPFSDCPAVDFSQIDIALIPGLGFDLKTLYRLGYGEGYYDRLLASNSVPHTCGIGFIEQEVDSLPFSKYDIPLKEIRLF